jgi:hypothetical protein
MTMTIELIPQLEAVSGLYGKDWELGVLSEHLNRVLIDHALVLHTAANGAKWVQPKAGGRGVRVVCSEIIAIRTEDGTIDGRCGIGTDPGGVFCPRHAPAVDIEATCEHGLSAHLCAGPGHYPPEV